MYITELQQLKVAENDLDWSALNQLHGGITPQAAEEKLKTVSGIS